MNGAATLFEEHRSFLESLALKLTGKPEDAEDLVHETYLRWQKLEPRSIEKPRAMLATILSRLAINQKTSARARREVTFEPGMLAEMKDAMSSNGPELSDALAHAFEIVLERMTPNERTVFLLREVFEFDYEVIAETIAESEANCRQLLKRAKDRISLPEKRYRSTPEREERLLKSFLEASRSGDLDTLMRCLREDAVLSKDAGDINQSAPPPVVGRSDILSYMADSCSKLNRASTTHFQIGNEYEAVIFRDGELAKAAFVALVKGETIARLYLFVCPARLEILSRIFEPA